MHLKEFNSSAVKDNIYWDLDLRTEFRGARHTGYSFVIDVLDGQPRLALYQLKMNYSTSTTLSKQPPTGMLLDAVREQDGHIGENNLYHINGTIRTWIENHLLIK